MFLFKKRKKKFYDKIMFIYLRICILKYVHALLPFSFGHSCVNIVLFIAKDTSSCSNYVPLFLFLFSTKTIFEPKEKKKCFVILKENK